MGTIKRSISWLRKYNDLKADDFPESLQKRLLWFKVMRIIVLISAGTWLAVPTLETLVLGGFGLVALYILTSIIEPKLDRDISNNTDLK